MNKKHYNKRFILSILLIILSAIIIFASLSGCYENAEIAKKLGQAENTEINETITEDLPQSITTDEEAAENNSNNDNETTSGSGSSDNVQDSSSTKISKGTSPTGGSVFGGFTTHIIDGLHVTGTEIDIDIKDYRLKITGLVKNELSLTFEEIKALPSVRIFAELDCPGFFVDEGYWTGVEIIHLLEMAGLKNDEAKTLVFSDYENSYSKSMDIEKINQEGFLVAYHFNDKEFATVHGFPLRIVAKGEYGSVWVKWLGEIKVE